MTPPVRFADLRRHYRGREVLSGLSFEVRPGEIYALLGRNGAGKTTALRTLLGFLKPHAGRAELFGVASEDLTDAVRARVGLVTEGQPHYPFLSVGEVLEFEAGTQARFDRALAERSIERLGLRKEAKVRQLSRGERAQLVLLAALAAGPELLVMDDPALGLDVAMRREFLDAMIELLGEEGRSVLYSSHILSDVERVADRVGILHGGRLIADLPLDDLKRRVARRFVRATQSAAEWRRSVPGLLRTKEGPGGTEVVVLNGSPETEQALRALDPTLAPALALSLEDVFLELTAGAEAGAVEQEVAR